MYIAEKQKPACGGEKGEPGTTVVRFRERKTGV
jgi:hypothetical protein